MGLGGIICYGTLRAENPKLIIFTVGLLTGGIPALSYWLYLRTQDRRQHQNHRQIVEDLIQHGHAMTIDLTRYQIKSNHWTEETARYDSHRVQMLNAIGGDEALNVKQVAHHHTHISFEAALNGKSICFEYTSSKDAETVRMLLEMHPQAIVYVDRTNHDRYYLDLPFLDS